MSNVEHVLINVSDEDVDPVVEEAVRLFTEFACLIHRRDCVARLFAVRDLGSSLMAIADEKMDGLRQAVSANDVVL